MQLQRFSCSLLPVALVSDARLWCRFAAGTAVTFFENTGFEITADFLGVSHPGPLRVPAHRRQHN